MKGYKQKQKKIYYLMGATLPTLPAARPSSPISHDTWWIVDGLLAIQTHGRKEPVIN